jgi:hypothetical protein
MTVLPGAGFGNEVDDIAFPEIKNDHSVESIRLSPKNNYTVIIIHTDTKRGIYSHLAAYESSIKTKIKAYASRKVTGRY